MEFVIQADWPELKKLARCFFIALRELPKDRMPHAMEAWRFAYAGFAPRDKFEKAMGAMLNNGVIQSYIRWKMGIDTPGNKSRPENPGAPRLK